MAEINSSLTELGIVPTFGQGPDIAVSAEFLDASFGSGTRKIAYEALIRLDPAAKTIFLFEKTTDMAGSLSAGSGSSAWGQLGTTLFRRVKSIQYGLDGKAFEQVLNLGEIPSRIRTVARAHGWRVRSVWRRSQVSWTGQSGSGPADSEPPANRAGKIGLTLLAVLAVLAGSAYIWLSARPGTYLIGLAVLVTTGFFLRKQDKGFLTVGILLLLSATLLLVALLVTTPA